MATIGLKKVCAIQMARMVFFCPKACPPAMVLSNRLPTRRPVAKSRRQTTRAMPATHSALLCRVASIFSRSVVVRAISNAKAKTQSQKEMLCLVRIYSWTFGTNRLSNIANMKGNRAKGTTFLQMMKNASKKLKSASAVPCAPKREKARGAMMAIAKLLDML